MARHRSPGVGETLSGGKVEVRRWPRRILGEAVDLDRRGGAREGAQQATLRRITRHAVHGVDERLPVGSDGARAVEHQRDRDPTLARRQRMVVTHVDEPVVRILVATLFVRCTETFAEPVVPTVAVPTYGWVWLPAPAELPPKTNWEMVLQPGGRALLAHVVRARRQNSRRAVPARIRRAEIRPRVGALR